MHPVISPHPLFSDVINIINNNYNNNDNNNENNRAKRMKLLSVIMVQIQNKETENEKTICELRNELAKQRSQQKKIDELKDQINILKNNICLPLATRRFTQDEICGISEQQCCVCMDKPKNHAFTGCGHMCVCGDCVDRCFNKCPLCRTEGSYMRIIY